jgi:Uma2 family endonuclease
VRTVILDPPPDAVAAALAERRRRGQDLFDEVWKGELHVVPAPHPRHGRTAAALRRVLADAAAQHGLLDSEPFNLGEPGDYRVPDGGYFEPDMYISGLSGTFVATAAVVVEVLSPEDETFEKFPFYAERGVREILVADPAQRRVRCWRLRNGEYEECRRSEVLDVDTAAVAAAIRWPD